MIKINNKIFEKIISDVEIENSISRIANEISSLKIENPIFLCVLNGSFIFASDLVRKINQNIEVSFVKISSYIGTKSTGAVKELIGLKNDIKKRNELFGQYDHLRIYGADFFGKIKSHGFKVERIRYCDNLSKDEIKKYGLIEDEIIPVCIKVE